MKGATRLVRTPGLLEVDRLDNQRLKRDPYAEFIQPLMGQGHREHPCLGRGGSEWGILIPPNCELRSLVQIRSLYSVGWTRISRANSPNRASLRSALTHPNPSRREAACITPMPPSPARLSCSSRAAFHPLPSAQPSHCPCP